MNTSHLSAIVAALVFSACLAVTASCCSGQETGPSPEAFYKQLVRSAEPKVGGGAGEQFCWRANYSMGSFVSAYKAWHDTAWLDWGVKFYDYAVSKMSTGPDGYKGWIGPYGYEKKFWCDVHVGDSILLDHMLEFAEVVLSDPALKARYAEPANRYVALARKDVIEKWDSRGTWREDGPFGAYVSWNRYCKPGDLKTWKTMPEVAGSDLTLPFNKQNDMALVCMKIYRITGQKFYRDKAEKIFAFMRSRFLYLDNHYVWNYWEPFGPWDVDLANKTTRHWMNVHSFRNYQAGEIHQIVEAYHTGLVFTQTDIQRIINTNLEVMWNKDRAAPKFVNSSATLPQPVLSEAERKAEEEKIKANPYSKEGRAGCLWTGLLDFSQTVRDLHALGLKADRKDTRSVIARSYYRNVTAKAPPSFKRHYVKGKVALPELPVSECRSLTVATVMPHIIRRGSGVKSVVLAKARIPVDLEVAVCSVDGKRKLLVLHKGKVDGGTDGLAGIFIIQWDGTDPSGKVKLARGAYRMRWTVGDGYREFPVTLVD